MTTQKFCFSKPLKRRMPGDGSTCLCFSTTMLLPFILFVSSSLSILVESYLVQIECHQNERGTRTTKDKWNCNPKELKCSRTVATCGSDGSGDEVAGWHLYQSDGSESAVGGGRWDCRFCDISLFNLLGDLSCQFQAQMSFLQARVQWKPIKDKMDQGSFIIVV